MERTGLLLVVGLLLAACSDDTGSSQDGAVADLFGTDGVLRDGTGLHDGLPTDGHAGDGAAGDASSTDGPSIADGAPPDTKPPVTGGPCINPVPPSQKPCASSPTALQTYCSTADPSKVIMATCIGSWTQCDADNACAPGWHLCSGTEYRARGGETVPQDSKIIRAWVGACARDVGGTQLKDGVCSSCATGDIGAPWAMLYDCSGNQLGPGMAGGTLAVVTSDLCMRLIQNTPATAAYWSLYWAGSGAGGSVCCLDSP